MHEEVEAHNPAVSIFLPVHLRILRVLCGSCFTAVFQLPEAMNRSRKDSLGTTGAVDFFRAIYVLSITMKDRLIELILEKAFQYSEEPKFKLVSGRMSNYYFNCKAVTLNPEGIYVIGNILYEMVKDLDIDAIGGLTLGADPLAFATAYTSYLNKNPIEAFVVRKKAKEHGTMQWIEGNVKEGDRVVIVDDVITTGKSTIEAIIRARDAGLEIVRIIALIDRQEGGREAVKEVGYDVTPVVTREEVMSVYRRDS